MSYDVLVFQFLNNFAGRNVAGDFLILFAASYLQYFVIAATLVFLWKKREAAIEIAIGIAAAIFLSRGVITEAIRYFYLKPRPFEILDVRQIVDHSAGGALPSGHAAFFFALAATVFIYDKKWGTGFFVAASAISIARVAGGVHWPADIIAGAFAGLFSTFLVYYGKQFFFEKGE